MKVLLTGATGLIGKELGKALAERGYDLFVVTRDAAKAWAQLPFPCKIIQGDLSAGPLRDVKELRLVTSVINLAGENIGGGRWNEARKRRIYESRILGTRNLIQSLPVVPRVFINASATGYYGSQGDADLTEESPAGDGFLAQVCQDWEEELLSFSYGDALSMTRVVALRTGMVLAAQGGALDKLLPLFRRGLGAPLGTGQQWMSWIHIEDVVGLTIQALENNNVRGPMNLVSPQPVRNEEFSKTLASLLGTGLAPRVPAVALKLAMGEMASLVLSSQKVQPKVARQSGYDFKYPELRGALEDICRQEDGVFVSEQYLPWTPAQIFPFFSQAVNLLKIMPPQMGVEVLSGASESLQLGSEVVFRMKLHGVSVKWKSRIDEWQPPYVFSDVQEEGPYRVWRHHHEFKPFMSGTLVIDRINYELPLGAAGKLLGGPWVRQELAKVFAYRREQLLARLEQELGPSL